MDKVTEHLIEGCRRGDRSSQLKLYKQYAQRLYIACLRIVGNSSEAEEAMQDSFLKIFTRLDQYHDGQCFEAWMHRIAIHTAIDYVRRQAPDQEELSDNLAEPETDGPDEEGNPIFRGTDKGSYQEVAGRLPHNPLALPL